jgi:hypothetical protein
MISKHTSQLQLIFLRKLYPINISKRIQGKKKICTTSQGGFKQPRETLHFNFVIRAMNVYVADILFSFLFFGFCVVFSLFL